ncbi:diguanylate cyclase domain-containing protein [Piscinibacter sakaiensis]|uniref:GGDEF domain-containing protein n=1 Tax=Piscinibacter sakaiensis TaxID=1547922 RepID=UPI003AB017B7
MRYRQQREQSAELLRLALAEMGRHQAAFTPLTFAVWYEHVAGINPPLSQAIEEQLRAETRFDDAMIERLHGEYVAELDAEKAENISERFQQLISGMADAASRTDETAGQFTSSLTALNDSLKSGDAGSVPNWLEDVLAGTTRMQQAVQQLNERVAKSQQEIANLRADLERERVDALLCPLSRVLNRRGFDVQLDAMLKSPPPEGHCHALLMLDIDHFKQVNDSHGHLMGDRVIQALGEVLKQCAEPAGATAARYGGEEFAVLLAATTAADSIRLAERLRKAVKAMKVRNRATNEVVLTVTVSAGVALSGAGDDAASLITRADAALYQSKQNGRDRVTAAAA